MSSARGSTATSSRLADEKSDKLLDFSELSFAAGCAIIRSIDARQPARHGENTVQIRYIDEKGQRVIVQLGANPLSIGRAPEADIVLNSGNVSRFHCSLRQWDDDFVIMDLHSENGTFVYGHREDVTSLYPGDKITLGTYSLYFEKRSRMQATANAVIKKIGKEMEEGRKGYSTMLVELVKETEKK